jgi:hypothetical protein
MTAKLLSLRSFLPHVITASHAEPLVVWLQDRDAAQ